MEGKKVGKAKVTVAKEKKKCKPGFAKRPQVERVSEDGIDKKVKPHREKDCVVRTDGWLAHGIVASEQSGHQPEVVGSGENTAQVPPWVHTVTANIKGNIHGVYRGVSSTHLRRYLPEFCSRFNRGFGESQMYNRILTTCVNTSTLTVSELKAESYFSILLFSIQPLMSDFGVVRFSFHLQTEGRPIAMAGLFVPALNEWRIIGSLHNAVAHGGIANQGACKSQEEKCSAQT